MFPYMKTTAVNLIILVKVLSIVSCREIASTNVVRGSNAENDTQVARVVRETGAETETEMEVETGRGMKNHDYQDVEEPKAQKPWLGYYDFLITEGSYKFWVVFQLFTIAILIYSAFAAIYYAKYTINDYDNYDDYLLGRSSGRSIRSVPSSQTAFLGLPVETYLQIINAIANFGNK